MTISIIIPVYNVAPYIDDCLRSVMRQTYVGAMECLIVDDCGTDESIPIAERMIAEYDGPIRFEILHHEHNRGLSAARNTGTMAAKGAYVYYLDSDDEITEDCLAKLTEPIRLDNSPEMVMGDYRLDYDAMPRSWWRRTQKPQSNRWLEETPEALHGNDAVRQWFYKGKWPKPVNVWNKLLRLDFIKTNQLFNQEGLLYEDNPWCIHLMRCLSHAAFVHDVTYLHHRRPGSICTGTDYEDRLQHFGQIFEEYAQNVISGERIEESAWFVRLFYTLYLEAHDNPRYQYAYHVFRRELSDGQHSREVVQLALAHHLGKTGVGRLFFKTMMLARRPILFIPRRIIRILHAR